MSLLSLPDQTIAESKKDKEWHMDHVRDHVVFTNQDNYNNQRDEILKYFRAYQGELNKKERELTKAITCPNGIDLGQEYIVYPLIQSKIEQIVGEFMLRPIRRKAYALDKKSTSDKLQAKVDMATEEIMREMTKELEQELGYKPETEGEGQELPTNIEEHFEKNHKMISEEVADSLIKLFLDVNKQKEKFRTQFTYYAICDRAHSVLTKKNGHTIQRAAHPLDCDYDLDPYKIVQDDHEYFYESLFLTENEIYNSFDLTKDQKQDVKDYFSTLTSDGDDVDSDGDLTISPTSNGWIKTDNKTHRLRAVIAKWKSIKRTNIKISKNNATGEDVYKKLPSDAKIKKRDKVKHIDKQVPRFCIMIGPEICLDYGIMPERYSRVDAPWACNLPIISIVRDNTIGSSKIKSVAAKLYQLQSIASEILFELRLALKSAGDSRVLVYDAAQMPKDFASTGGLNRVLSHIKKDKLLIINSADKKNSKQQFNQFTSLDMSQKGGVQELYAGLAYIEDLASKFVGITPEREGQVGQYQTATGTDKAIRGSAARTEVIYTPFDEFIQNVLERAIMKMQHDYSEGQVIQYVFGEFKTKFITIFKEFFGADLGIYLADGRKDLEMSERINAATELAIQTSNTPEMMMGLIEVFEGESASEKKATFARILNQLDKVREENAKAAQQQAQAESEAKANKEAEDAKLIREGYQKDIDVALIYKDGKSRDGQMKNLSSERQTAAKIDGDLQKNRESNQATENKKE